MENRAYEPCLCGSGKKFKFCCYQNRSLIDGLPDSDLIKKSAEFPVYESFVSNGWQDDGLAQIVIVRQLPNLKYLLGVYLVDTFCLGLKDTFVHTHLKHNDLSEFLSRFPSEMVECPYEDARSIILGSIEYAKQIGFEPYKDWKHTRYFIEDTRDFDRIFSFGKDGVPFYIQGPNDDTDKILKILNPLMVNGKAHVQTFEDKNDDFSFDELIDTIEKQSGLTIDQYMENKKTFDGAFDAMTSGDFQNAISGFSKVLAIEPNHVQSHGNIGIVYASIGDLEHAHKHIDRALELDPDYQPAIENRKLIKSLAPGEKLKIQDIHEVDFYAEKTMALHQR